MAVLQPSPPPRNLKPAAAESKTKEWHLFSAALAEEISTKQPDITAAILLYGISLWLKNNYSYTLVKGERFCFRSLSELSKDHPYFTEPCIEKAILRAEKKGFLTIDRSKTKNWYSLPPEVRRMCTRSKGHIWFKISDAVDYGINESILLANHQWQTEYVSTFEKDGSGTRYYSLGPGPLSRYLPFSRQTIRRTLTDLTEAAVLVEHPEHEHYYTRPVVHGPEKPLVAEILPRPELDTSGAEVDRRASEVDRGVSEVDDSPGIDSNQVARDESKDENSIDRPHPAPAPPRCGEEDCNISIGLTNLLKIAEDIRVHQQKAIAAPKPDPVIHRVHEEDTPYDDFTQASPIDDLPYDDYRTASPFNFLPYEYFGLNERAQDIEDDIWFFCARFAGTKLTATDEDEQLLRRFFVDNPHIRENLLSEVLGSCFLVQSDITPQSTVLISPNLVGDWRKPKKGAWDHYLFARKVNSLGYFLKRLPEILTQFGVFDEAPYKDIDFAYLGKPRKNSLVQLDWK